MSLVGPRPALEYELQYYKDAHYERFAVKPGMTGLWQVSGRNELGFTEMLDLDAEYARTQQPPHRPEDPREDAGGRHLGRCMSAVPFIDLGRAHEPLQAELAATFERIARSGAFTLAAELDEFEAAFADYCGAAHCVGMSDGTEALRLALVALGAGPGREVVTVPSTFIATLEAIAATGAKPVLVDIDPATRCMDPERLADAVGPRDGGGRAGAPVRAARRRWTRSSPPATASPVLEDAAQAHGASVDGRRTGTLGTVGGVQLLPDEEPRRARRRGRGRHRRRRAGGRDALAAPPRPRAG